MTGPSQRCEGYSEADGQLGILAHRTISKCALTPQPPVRTDLYSLAQYGSTGAIVVGILGLSESDTARKPHLEGCWGAWDGWAGQGCQGALAGAAEVAAGSD